MNGNDQNLSVPSQIGPYHIERLIQRGSLHESYRGFDLQKRNPVFIKRLVAPSNLPNEQFTRELLILRQVSHPGICRLLQAGMESGRPYLVCEYVQGLSLREFLIQQRPQPSEGYYLLGQIGQALSYLHARRIIHNDLKPENILVTPSLKTILVDFSIAQSLQRNEDRKARQLAGTLLYMSPEQQTQQELSAASDLYSFAIIAYELIQGRLSHGLVELSLLPGPIREVFEKALQSEPKQRFGSVHQFLEQLEQVKDAIPGSNLPLRRQRDRSFLIDPCPRLQHWAAGSELFFTPSSYFGTSRELLSFRSTRRGLTVAFIRATKHDEGPLFYLKALLEARNEQSWELEALREALDRLAISLELEEPLDIALLQLEWKQGRCTAQVGLHGQMSVSLCSGNWQILASSSGWQQQQLKLQPYDRLFLFCNPGCSSEQLVDLIGTSHTLACGALAPAAQLSSRLLGDAQPKTAEGAPLNYWQSILALGCDPLSSAEPTSS